MRLYLHGKGVNTKKVGKILSNIHNSKRFLEKHDELLIMDPCHSVSHPIADVYTWCMQNMTSKWGHLKPSTFFWFKDSNDAALFRLMWSA